MDSVLLSRPAPSHSNTAASARQRVLFDSIFNASRPGTSASNDSGRPLRPTTRDSSAGQRSNRGLGERLFGDRAEHLMPRPSGRPMLPSQHYAPTGSYVPINLQPVATENYWGDQAQSPSDGGPRRRQRGERAREWRSYRRRHEPFEVHDRSCSSILREGYLRRKLYTLGTAGIFFIVVLAVYLAFTASHAPIGRELHILLIFMLLIIAIVFCHAFVRFVLAVARGPTIASRHRIPNHLGPGGYAEPDRPIPVVLAADEEIMATNSGVTTREKPAAPPPAYGLWRSSVRINPDLLHWQRVNHNRTMSNENSPAQRPPSYASDDGVGYVIEAQARSFVPDRGPCQDRAPETSQFPQQHTT